MEFEDYLRVFRTHWVALVLLTLLGGALGYGYSMTQERVYESTASAIVTTGVSSDLGSALVGQNYANARVKSYVDIANSRSVAEYVIDDLGLDTSPATLVGQVSVSNPEDTAVLRVTASADTPEGARQLAEAWIDGMVAAVDDIEGGGTASGEESVVQLRTLDSAVAPGAPSSPNVPLLVALGALVGFVLGVSYALIRNVLDKKIRSTKDIERNFTLPVLGAIPRDASFARAGTAAGGTDFATAESLRRLRTNLAFVDVDHPPRVIVVTSPLPGDGKSTTSVKLAQTIAESGQRVVLIDGDLRRPSVAEYLHLVPGIGLTDVLVGRVTLAEAIQDYGPGGYLRVLGAGAIPPNPSELLGSLAMQDVLAKLSKDAVVIIDTPPLIPVTDAAVLTARTDGAVIVARAGKTTTDILDNALVNLDRVKGRALGVVLDGVARKGEAGKYYGYEYEYVADDGSKKKRKRAAHAGSR